jgi:predicted nicotinamide N-methyase
VWVDDLVQRHTRLTSVPLVPELQLHRTDDVYGLWEATAEPAPPFWALPWAGGQALARYLLDHPHVVRGRSVLDVGAGSGLVAIAAVRAGARAAIAADIDPGAVAAIGRNARANRVTVHTILGDPLDGSGGDADIVVVGDAFYERQLAARMTAFLRRAVARGAEVLIGDLGRRYLPADLLVPIASYDVPVLADIEDAAVKHTTVFSFHSGATVTA